MPFIERNSTPLNLKNTYFNICIHNMQQDPSLQLLRIWLQDSIMMQLNWHVFHTLNVPCSVKKKMLLLFFPVQNNTQSKETKKKKLQRAHYCLGESEALGRTLGDEKSLGWWRKLCIWMWLTGRVDVAFEVIRERFVACHISSHWACVLSWSSHALRRGFQSQWKALSSRLT